MSCPSGEQLRGFLDEQLEDVERDTIEKHAESCAACQQRLAELSGAAFVAPARPRPQFEPDEAFLRRIPYKIEVIDPTEEAFRALFKLVCPRLGVEYNEAAINHLIEKHYKAVGRKYRSCQPRDLLLQVRNHCFYQGKPAQLTPEAFDFATSNYFAVM